NTTGVLLAGCRALRGVPACFTTQPGASPMNQNKKTYEDRRDDRFFQATRAALQDIDERLTTLPLDERYAGAYGVLRGYFENLLVNFAGCFSPEQLAEIRIVLDQLEHITGEDTHLPEATRS